MILFFCAMEELEEDERGTVEQLYRTYRDTVAGVIIRTLGGNGKFAVLDDLIQEVFLRVIRYKDKFVGMSPDYQRNLLAVMTRNVCYSYAARENRNQTASVEYLLQENEESGEPLPAALRSDEDALEILMKKENRAILKEAIDRMGSPVREMLIYKYAAGMKNTEIATLYRMNANTVGTLLFRALRELKQELEERIDDDNL